MGASEWFYVMPLEADVEAAFQKLRATVYEEIAPQYGTRAERIADLAYSLENLEREFPEQQEELLEAMRDELTGELEGLRALPEPATLDERIRELQWICGADGSGSILDVRGLSMQPDEWMLAPLTEEELIRLFGTTEPTRKIVEENRTAFTGIRSRGVGSYVLLYEEGVPIAVCFGGYSGD